MSSHFWGTTSFAEEQARTAQLVFWGAMILAVGPLAVVIGWWLRHQLRWWHYVGLAPLGTWWVHWWWQWLSHHSFRPLSLVVWWWGGLVVASPLLALVLQGWTLLSELLRPRDLQDQLEEQQHELQRKNAQLSRRAAAYTAHAVPTVAGMMTVGAYVKGDANFPPQLGVRRFQSWVQVSEPLLNQHLLIVGTTGAGKSETIKRLVRETLRVGQRDIFFVDGKGDLKLGREIAQLIYAQHGVAVPVFSLGTDHQGCVYHGFCGAATDIYNRLGALVGVEEAAGDGRYYADLNRDLLQLVCYAPAGPPRSFEAIRQRLRLVQVGLNKPMV